MKSIIFFVLGAFFSQTLCAQVPQQEMTEFPDVEAQFPGGAPALSRYIQENVHYPMKAIELNEQGKVYVSFVVEPNGSISNIKVVRGVSKHIDEEAKRIVRNMPRWKPGEAGGRVCRTRCHLPIVFILEDDTEEEPKKN